MGTSGKFELDPALEAYATERQWRCLVAWRDHGSLRKAARSLGMHNKGIVVARERVLKKAARAGYSPQAPAFDAKGKVPPGYVLRGQSALVDAEGNLAQRWDKTRMEGMAPDEARRLPDPKVVSRLSTHTDAEGRVLSQWATERPEDSLRERLWHECIQGLVSELPRAKPLKVAKAFAEDICVGVPVGDLHVGMLAWHEENGGDNFDLDECRRLFCGALDHLVAATPAAGVALLALLGDFVHADGNKPVTPQSGHQLDVDSRPSQRIRVAMELARYAIAALARRHGRVHVIVEIGNHDPYSAVFLAEALAAIYEREPGVMVDRSPRHYHYFRHGKVLVGTHHGDLTRMQDLPLVMAQDRPADWGQTEFRYWWTGHVHHRQKLAAKDYGQVSVESFRIISPGDAYSDRSGYRALRDMHAVILHKDHGEVGRQVVNPSMLL